MKVRIVCLRNTLTRTRRVCVCFISNAGNEVGREKKRAIIPQFSDQTHQTYRATWSGLNWKLGWWGREVRKVCVCVCHTLSTGKADVVCALLLQRVITMLDTHVSTQCGACELHRPILSVQCEQRCRKSCYQTAHMAEYRQWKRDEWCLQAVGHSRSLSVLQIVQMRWCSTFAPQPYILQISGVAYTISSLLVSTVMSVVNIQYCMYKL